MSEKTLCIIKPDAVENNFVDQINEMIESKGLSLSLIHIWTLPTMLMV